jgi:hypothetical protein
MLWPASPRVRPAAGPSPQVTTCVLRRASLRWPATGDDMRASLRWPALVGSGGLGTGARSTRRLLACFDETGVAVVAGPRLDDPGGNAEQPPEPDIDGFGHVCLTPPCCYGRSLLDPGRSRWVGALFALQVEAISREGRQIGGVGPLMPGDGIGVALHRRFV